MKILITNVYCYLNKGDAGIVIAMIENIKKIVPDCTITLMSLYPEMDQGKYSEDVNVVKPPIEVDSKNTGIHKVIRNTMSFIRLVRRLNKGELDEAEKLVKDADIVISCGGGYMQSFNIKHFFMDFIYHYAQLYTAKYYKKPYYIFAQTIGPFSKSTRLLVKPIINKADMVLTRECISYEYAQKFFNNPNTLLTSDVAFLLHSVKSCIEIDKGYTNVGITMRQWGFPNHANSKELMNNYEEALVGFINWLSSHESFRVYIMPQCVGPNTDNDLIISKRVLDKIANRKNVFLLELDLTPGQLKYLYGEMDYFVGTRMHSNIFALGENVPCLAISYDPKTDGIMQLVGMERYVVDINNINPNMLQSTFLELMNDKMVKQIIKDRVDDIKKNAFYNFEKIFFEEDN